MDNSKKMVIFPKGTACVHAGGNDVPTLYVYTVAMCHLQVV